MKDTLNEEKTLEQRIKEHPFSVILSTFVSTAVVCISATSYITTSYISDSNEALKLELSTKKEELVELKEDLKKLKSNLNSEKQENSKLKDRLSESDKYKIEIKNLLDKSNKSDEKIEILNNELLSREKEISKLNQVNIQNAALIKENNQLKSNYKTLTSNLNNLTNIDKEIKKLEAQEKIYQACPHSLYPKTTEVIEQCKQDLQYVREELSKLRQKLPY